MTVFNAEVLKSLVDGIAALGVSCQEAQVSQLTAYLQLLLRWNKAYNLTAITDPMEMVTKHVHDSLAILPYLDKTRYLDVGSGAGLPGIPLAICAPDKQFTLLDSNGKKTRFLSQVKMELRLSNVEIVHARVETWHPAARYQGLFCRAFASLTDFLEQTQHLCSEGGEWIAMKGTLPEDERRAIIGLTGVRLIPLEVPGLAAARHLVIIKKDQYAESDSNQ